MIRPFRFRHNPVRSLADVTGNFEHLEPLLPYNTPAIGYRSVTQGIPDKTLTRLKIDTASSDPFGLLDLTKGWYRVPSTGYYQVNLSILLEVAAGTEVVALPIIYVNEVRTVDGAHFGYKAAVEGFASGCVSGIVQAKRGAHIEGWIYQASAAERKTFPAFSASNQLSVVRVA